MASDGLWDMVSSEEAVEIAMKQGSAHSAATALRKVAIKRWTADEGAPLDDITITVVNFQCERHPQNGRAFGAGGGSNFSDVPKWSEPGEAANWECALVANTEAKASSDAHRGSSK